MTVPTVPASGPHRLLCQLGQDLVLGAEGVWGGEQWPVSFSGTPGAQSKKEELFQVGLSPFGPQEIWAPLSHKGS